MTLITTLNSILLSMFRKGIFSSIILISAFTAVSQNKLIVGLPVIEDYYRRSQLVENNDSSASFLLRPIYLNSTESRGLYTPETKSDLLKPQVKFSSSKTPWFDFSFLPVQINSQYTEKQPYGWNDGALIPASGYQQTISAGFNTRVGPLSLQFYPTYQYAENKSFEGIPLDQGSVLWARYYSYTLNSIDQPERYGDGNYEKFLWGQSSIRLNAGPISLGLSNENLWWGPGRFNSLVMTNNARGFKHLTINSIKPIKSWLGSFEFQMIGGRLDESGFLPPGNNIVHNGRFIYRPKVNDWRYLSGIMFSYQPKWIPGLYLGATRVVQQYHENAKESKDYFGAVSNLWRKNDPGGIATEIQRDQLASAFLRFVWPEIQTEVYFEFGRNDAAQNFRDFFLEPWHSAAYNAGFRKLFPFQQKEDQKIDASFEFTQLQQSAGRIIREAGTFYIHSRVRHGYTHNGEVLGAGIGPGSNLQTLEVNWVNELKKIGLTFERYVHNNDYYFFAFNDIQDPRRHWVDISAFSNLSWDFGNLLINARLGVIKSLNYQYQIQDQIVPGAQYFVPGKDVINFKSSLDLIYRF
tara:strand:- start:465996 stop:467732 length:1737 start_codon:yes stop_codon:yes gene_type:complete